MLDHALDGRSRIALLDRLQDKALTPLIRSTRMHCFKQALRGEDRARALEHAVAEFHDSKNEVPYVRGDVICNDDHVLFLIFGDAAEETPAIHAGIIYEPDTREPMRKLDAFCETVQEALEAERGRSYVTDAAEKPRSFEWRPAPSAGQRGLDHLMAKLDRDALSLIVRQESAIARIRAAEFLEDTNARDYLKRAFQVFNEGSPTFLLSNSTVSTNDFSTEQMMNAGLIKREVIISCRKTGHTIFRLPSADGLAVVTVAQATCSECGTLIADEKVEDVHTPTRLATALLEDGSWLVTRIHAVLRELGLPEGEIAIGPATDDGYSHIMANVCGESFLFVLRDGNLTPALARLAIDLSLETQATHLVVVATGNIQNEGRVRLMEYSRRRARGGEEVAVFVLQGVASAATELRDVFERVSQQVISTQLCELDSNIGFNLSRMIIGRSQLLHKTNLALAASL
jgi:hypothetical protein